MNKKPNALKPLAPLFVVQFACWCGMFLMWIGAYPVVTLSILPAGSPVRQGMLILAGCFSWYATLSAGLAFVIPSLLRHIDPPRLLAAATVVGAGGLGSLGLIHEPWLLPVSFSALAIGWSALSNLPYTIAGELVDPEEIDHGFRVFAFSTILPQLAVTGALVFLIGDIDAQTARQIMLAAAAAMLTGSALALLLRHQLWRGEHLHEAE